MPVIRTVRRGIPQGEHFDPKASAANPIWYLVDVRYRIPFPTPVTLGDIKNNPLLGDMPLVKRSRLSIHPVSDLEWQLILTMGGLPEGIRPL